jgi:hypothetical protein
VELNLTNTLFDLLPSKAGVITYLKRIGIRFMLWTWFLLVLFCFFEIRKNLCLKYDAGGWILIGSGMGVDTHRFCHITERSASLNYRLSQKAAAPDPVS